MSERPSLNQIKDGKTLREYYFFARKHGFSDISHRIKSALSRFLQLSYIINRNSPRTNLIFCLILYNFVLALSIRFGAFSANIRQKSSNFPVYPQKSRLFRAAILQKIPVISRLCFHSRK